MKHSPKSIPDHVYRGYDLRGLVGPDLDAERVELLGKGYATWLLQRRIYDCVVGYDSRLSSPAFRDALVKGLTSSGITVYDIGITLSQICYFAQYYFRTRGMVMITASHNPKEFNGFKFATGFSETMLTDDIIRFKNLVNKGAFIKSKTQGKHIKKDISRIYIDDVIKRSDPIKPFKVVVDSCAATTGLFLPKIFKKLGCTVIEQNTKVDGNFPVGVADPTESEVQERLAKRVLKEKADIGFSYDTDGDRVGVVDNKGNLIWNDILVSIFAQDVLEYLPGSNIVFNTLCSKQVKEVVQKAGGVPIIWNTGHSFIKAKVRDVNAPFGGELSGHFYFVDNFYGHDDGAVASLRILAYLTRKKKQLSDVVADLPHYFSSPEIKVGCPDKIKFNIVTNKIGLQIKKLYPSAEFIEIDGVRMDSKNEMLIVRASQNGPYLTVKFEAKTQKMYNILKTQVKEILKSIREVDFTSGVNVSSLD